MRVRIFLLLWSQVLFAIAGSSQTVTTIATLTALNETPSQLVQGRDGMLYGTGFYGGEKGAGSVFRVDPATGKVAQVYSFTGEDGDGPEGLTLATDGNFYGATAFLGPAKTGDGVVYKVTPAGKLTVLHTFNLSDGAYPYAPPVEAANGKFYGTTGNGGESLCSCGVVYQISSSGQFAVIYEFAGLNGTGGEPRTVPLQGSNGALNVPAYTQGPYDGGGVVQLTTAGKLTNSYAFNSFEGTGPIIPDGTLIQGADGNFYGTSFDGGTGGVYGTVYRLSQSYELQVVYNFSLATGTSPTSGVIQGTDGYLYGTTSPEYEDGTLYQLSTSGNFVLLDATLGSSYNGLVQHTNGNFYGVTNNGDSGGTIFELDMGLGPFIALVNPLGEAGTDVGILGQGFTGTTSVTFNGKPASSFKVISDTYMTAVAPATVETGPVVVTTPGGTLSSNRNFEVE